MAFDVMDFVFGRSLSDQEEHGQRLGPAMAIPVLGLDAISSSAYGPEAAATVLLALGAAGVQYVLPITVAISILLLIVFFSYRQTIEAYPSGGGSYTVARENLGVFCGLLAAAALMLDYILDVAVGISAGIGAMISALPSLQPYTLSLCLITLVVLTVVNLRGVKEAGWVFLIPTYLFVGSLGGIILYGVYQVVASGGHPASVVDHHSQSGLSIAAESFSWWLIIRAFASGCTAMTGVEAVSNCMKVFAEPVTSNAKRTLGLIVSILGFLLIGIAYLSSAYGLVATDPGAPGYESLLSELTSSIVGRGVIYNITLASIVLVLMFSANTGYADFPRLCQILARDNFMPHIFAERGRRLVFTYGIFFISAVAGILLILFKGITDALIPLFAIGAFLAFTLSQAGMVVHWWKDKSSKHRLKLASINGIGAIATGITLIVIIVSKFSEGGWLTVVMIPLLMYGFYSVRRHYDGVTVAIATEDKLSFNEAHRPIVIVPVRGWSRMTLKAMRFAVKISDDIYGVFVNNTGSDESFVKKSWQEFVADPASEAGKEIPKLVCLESPYRRVFSPLMNFIDDMEKSHPDRQIVVLIPNLVEVKWYHYFLHNQRALLLQGVLRLRADKKIIVISVPWYL
jgi:amino acid transporter